MAYEKQIQACNGKKKARQKSLLELRSEVISSVQVARTISAARTFLLKQVLVMKGGNQCRCTASQWINADLL